LGTPLIISQSGRRGGTGAGSTLCRCEFTMRRGFEQ
jgi:hypothetical protein